MTIVIIVDNWWQLLTIVGNYWWLLTIVATFLTSTTSKSNSTTNTLENKQNFRNRESMKNPPIILLWVAPAPVALIQAKVLQALGLLVIVHNLDLFLTNSHNGHGSKYNHSLGHFFPPFQWRVVTVNNLSSIHINRPPILSSLICKILIWQHGALDKDWAVSSRPSHSDKVSWGLSRAPIKYSPS